MRQADGYIRSAIRLLVVAGMTLGLGGCLGFIDLILGAVPEVETPPVLEKNGVVVASLPLKATPYFSDPVLGTITDIAQGEFLPDEGLELAVVSDTGAAFLDSSGALLKKVRLDCFASGVNIITLGKEQTPHFLKRGGWVEAPTTPR